MCMRRRIMYENAAFCLPEMRKKNSSLPREISTIKINITLFVTSMRSLISILFELVLVFVMVSKDVIIM